LEFICPGEWHWEFERQTQPGNNVVTLLREEMMQAKNFSKYCIIDEFIYAAVITQIVDKNNSNPAVIPEAYCVLITTDFKNKTG